MQSMARRMHLCITVFETLVLISNSTLALNKGKQFRIFFFKYLVRFIVCVTFATMIQPCVTYPIYKKGVNLMQRNLYFFASFHTDYLVNSNNLLTHTHTHTHTSHRRSDNTLNAFSYARAKRVVSPINKGLQGVPFVRFFVPVCKVRKGQNNRIFLSN